ncbi:PREDICTED: uncharacterized protein LOC104799478 [Tarenaya hassleriana]|uniref:uncharacterized protein LOC104799478 n=1 Tax=Tarenaya hassleriana TaxID=28532 RepID=UPI00053C2F1A|nr:PREDICTED: uncharacterized protein LOC104799478 [Tarenaya hassleriana]
MTDSTGSVTPPPPIQSQAHDSYASPYYLGPNDQTNLILVSRPLTGATDFNSWHRSMSMALEGRNKLGFVDGTLPKPPDSDSDSALWSRANLMVSAWIMSSVSAEIHANLLYVKTARQMWQILLKCFQQQHAPRRFSLKRRMYALQQGSLDVTTFFNRLCALWEERKSLRSSPYCECGKCTCNVDNRWNDMFEEEFVMDFLFGLNDSYENIVDQILLIDPLPDLQKTFHLVNQHEHQRRIKAIPAMDNPTFQVSAQASKPSDLIAAVSGTLFKPKSKPLCTHCGMYGHTIHKCYKLHGYPPGYRSNSRNSDYKSVSATPLPKNLNQSKGTVAAVQSDSGLNSSSPSDNDLFSPQQLQKLYQMLGERLNISSPPTVSASGAPDKSGSYSGLHDWEG